MDYQYNIERQKSCIDRKYNAQSSPLFYQQKEQYLINHAKNKEEAHTKQHLPYRSLANLNEFKLQQEYHRKLDFDHLVNKKHQKISDEYDLLNHKSSSSIRSNKSPRFPITPNIETTKS